MDKYLLDEKTENLMEFIGSKHYKPMKMKEIASFLNVSKADRALLSLALDKLVSTGKLMQDSQGRYLLAGADTLAGIYMGTTRGFGFVRVEGENEDIYIDQRDAKSAHDRDKVLVKVKPGKVYAGRSREGVIISITERANPTVVGTFEKNKGNFGFVIPDNQKYGDDIFITRGFTMGAVTGHKVEVEITDFGNCDHQPEGRIANILGHINDPGVDIISIIKANNIPTEYPEEVMNFLESVPDEVSEEAKKNRLDLRDLMTVTIDGEDAKDLDDAISLSFENGIYHLGVHIADVSEYVTENSPLDKEALNRGTSVYLVDRVIPMLPHKLSNGICSLNQGTDRLALSCLMDIDEAGNIIGHRVAETLIRVDRRMSYNQVNGIISDHDENLCREYEDFVPMFELMASLSALLRDKRHARGALDFDIAEAKILVDEECRPVEIVMRERNKATKLIEDFMLAANETIAEDFFWQDIPFVYRNHENPDPEKIKRLGIFINNFGYRLKAGTDEIHPKEIQKLLAKIEGTDEEAMISRLTLRSMKQAKYTTGCDGHFGLAAKYYCHFTSPIRRYPDLQIHRIIKESLRGNLDEKRIEHYSNILPEVAASASRNERRAEETERDVEKMKKAQYMERHVGEVYEGVISGVTSFGIFVELPNTIEGMVRAASMTDDYYVYDEEHAMMVGRSFNKTYKLGQRVVIKVIGADRIQKTVDFALYDRRERQDIS